MEPILVTERLPDLDTDVLVFLGSEFDDGTIRNHRWELKQLHRHEHQDVGLHWVGDGDEEWGYFHYLKHATHWLPLPPNPS